MFSLNEDNRFVMAQHPNDMRMGVNAMCGQVRMVGLNPAGGDVYVFVGKSRKVMKVLHWERGQRPSVMGRKNYLFSKNDRGAEDNAVFYSLLESCDIVAVKPLQWLTHALERLRTDSTEDEITALLPYNYKKSQE